MKETIYTIPVNEVFSEKCFCPFCKLYARLEQEEIKYALGPAMMEPDYRAITNEQGFCKHHMREVNALPKALALSLVIESHLDTIKEAFDIDVLGEKKKLSLKKETTKKDEHKEKINAVNNGCAICSKINRHFLRYIDTFIDMAKDKEFLEKIKESDGFCLPHYELIFDAARKKLSGKDFKEIFGVIMEAEKKKFEKYEKDIKTFIESFDYQNAGKTCSAPSDTVIKASYFLNGEFDKPNKKLEDV